MDSDLERRFGGIGRLYGDAALAAFRNASVAVIGIGGVGSWVAEALARCAVGRITLIDLDNVAESNTNRQIHALGDAYGKAKVTAMAERIRAINPACVVTEIEEFVMPENTAALLDRNFDVVIDAIDQVRAKVAMIAWCRRQNLPIVVAGGAGGKIDPSRIRLDDLSRTEQDPLIARVRSQLRKEHGFTRDPKKKFGIPVVYSAEPIRQPVSGAACETGTVHGGLNCAGFGSSVCITATFGLFAASAALGLIQEKA
ncbi:MAG TPA: tRNA threonylcarbamoyladenosine dehydratase [Azospira sp.]|nr:tRNA threonylcarbamoyladenosine dehydratase [Azospira sp.]HNN08324.1 tRNA threonylcarbamoyladenosine dehydratase [Azospira sp.]HNN44874.1 tRNA threonylcarbamoyladenosine dehydratase [Azospira sp.]